MDINPTDVGFAAAVLPPLIALINQRRWPAQLKALVALAVCLLYSLVAVWLRGDGMHFADWRDVALAVSGSTLAAYHLLWRPSGWAPTIERSINGGPSVEAPSVQGSEAAPF